ncbi:DUF2247 family protein [Priestia endophytica]|uniref:DUF2247 family protein n=1 Tax=Priestia endophytica TaxID=135735 RepID=UPI000DCA5E65|nr:DUF2247 family protein [Priestia endophytica]RAS85600.1 hypothetical protein A4U60_09430 [Priestia endophytica]
MYKVEIIKGNAFDCNWTTLLVGRQLKLIPSLEVTKYAVRYLENNPTVNDELILELAWEQEEDQVDGLLERITSKSSPEVMDKEYHKWLYSVLKEKYSGALLNDDVEDSVFREVENIFSMFNTPEHMYEFFRKVSDAFYYPGDSKQTIHQIIKEFLSTERQLALN